MVAVAKSVDEIIARIVSREATMHPTLRGMWAIQGLSALGIALMLTADFLMWPLPFSLDFLATLGPPLRVLPAFVLVLEGVLVAQRFRRHDEPPYAQLVQSAALALGALGAVAAGVGLVLGLAWAALLSSFFPDFSWLQTLASLLMLCGAGAVLAALPTLAGSLVHPLVSE